tara:strand:+ start:42 stop:209 length:168 start_codon:yes stop_codon:yes gene_type:complete
MSGACGTPFSATPFKLSGRWHRFTLTNKGDSAITAVAFATLSSTAEDVETARFDF